MVSYNLMNRFAFLFVLTACVLSVSATIARSNLQTAVPQKFSSFMSFEVFEQTFSADMPDIPLAYKAYLKSMMTEMLQLDLQWSPEFRALFNLWELEKLKTVPDVKLLKHLIAPLKIVGPSALDVDYRKRLTVYIQYYVNTFRLFNLKHQLGNTVDEARAALDAGDRVTREDRQLYRDIAADLITIFEESDQRKRQRTGGESAITLDFRFALDRAKTQPFIPAMDYQDFSIYGKSNATWESNRGIYRKYLQVLTNYAESEMYRFEMEDSYFDPKFELVPLPSGRVFPKSRFSEVRRENYQYFKDLWTEEGKQGFAGTPDLIAFGFGLKDLNVLVSSLDTPEMRSDVTLKMKQFFKIVLYNLSSVEVENLSTLSQYTDLRSKIQSAAKSGGIFWEKLSEKNANWKKILKKAEADK